MRLLQPSPVPLSSEGMSFTFSPPSLFPPKCISPSPPLLSCSSASSFPLWIWILRLLEIATASVGGFSAYGILYLVVFTGPECVNCYYKPYLIGISLWIAVFLFSYLAHLHHSWDLPIELLLLTFILVTGAEFVRDLELINLSYVFTRLGMVIAGISIAFLVSYFFFPMKGSTLVHQGVKGILATDFGYILSQVLDPYVNSDTETFTPEKKGDIYASASTLFSKTGQLKSLIDIADGELRGIDLKKFRLIRFPAQNFTKVIFCANQIMYITLTLFYGLYGEASNTSYTQLFKSQIEATSTRFRLLFTDLARMMDDRQEPLSNVLSHMQIIQLLLSQMAAKHRQLTKDGKTLKYPFVDVQAFLHLWSCLKLYLRKVTHLVDAVERLYSE